LNLDTTDKHTDSELKKIYGLKNIAVVGMSKNEGKAAHYVPKYLINNGYDVVPVNPTSTEIMQRKSYRSISDIEQDIDIVDIFRRSEDVLEVVREAVNKKGIRVIWMQEGIYNDEAEKIATKKGIDVVFNRCIMAEHKRLFH